LAESITKLQRWLDLIVYLVGRRQPVTVDEVMEHIPAYAKRWLTGEKTAQDTARRTFERDKDELRRFGIPIRTVKYNVHGGEQVEGYRVDRRDFYLPYLKLVHGLARAGASYPERSRIPEVELRANDARVALDALRRVAALPAFPLAKEAASAFRKLAFDLDPDVARDAQVLFLDRPVTPELREELRVLSDAVVARKRATFSYRGVTRDEATVREVDPYGLVFLHGHWYLVGHDALRADVRLFRVDRMGDVARNEKAPNAPDYTVPADFTLDAYVRRQPWELGEVARPARVVVRFRFPTSLWAERNSHGSEVRREPDGSVQRAFDVHRTDPFVRWLLGFGTAIDIVEPQSLADELRGHAAAIADRHAAVRHG
jgi:proteasome accessory factor B